MLSCESSLVRFNLNSCMHIVGFVTQNKSCSYIVPLKVPKNGQQKTCNLSCNISAKRVE